MPLCASRKSIPRAGYNLLQLSVSADNSIQPRFWSSAASRPVATCLLTTGPTRSNRAAASSGRYGLLSAVVADGMSGDRHNSNVAGRFSRTRSQGGLGEVATISGNR
jgi:hypothetical protein